MSWASIGQVKQTFKNKSEKMMSDIFSDSITQDEKEPYTPQLRGSSLPICILLHAHDLLKPHVRPKPARLDQYSEFGTAAHNLFQKKVMQSKKWGKYLFGDWECKNIKCEKIIYRFQCRPADWATHKCTCGTVGLKYRELEGFYKGVLGIHVDMVLKFKGDVFWVTEYKTTGSFKIKDPKMDFKPKHFFQASSYPIILEDVFGIKAQKFFIGYVNRDAPQFSATAQRQHKFFSFDCNTELMKKRREQLDRLVEGEKARKAYFENPTVKNLKKLDSLRPCKCKADYFEPLMGMHGKYEPSESCPFLKKGGCFQGDSMSSAAKKLHQIIKEKSNEV